MLGILMLNVQERHLAVMQAALTAHGLLWEIMDNVDNA